MFLGIYSYKQKPGHPIHQIQIRLGQSEQRCTGTLSLFLYSLVMFMV